METYLPGNERTSSFEHNLFLGENMLLLACVDNVLLPKTLEGKCPCVVVLQLNLDNNLDE